VGGGEDEGGGFDEPPLPPPPQDVRTTTHTAATALVKRDSILLAMIYPFVLRAGRVMPHAAGA
jgi:hypothetical protein